MPKALLKAMEELVQVHEQIIQIEEEKKDVLVKGNIQRLETLVQEENKLVKRLGQVEEQRMQEVKALLDRQQVREKNMTLNDLLHILPSEQDRQTLQSVTDQLVQKINQLKELNHLNQKLTQDSLDFVHHSIELLKENKSSSYNYNSPSQSNKQGPSSKSFFDTKA